VKTWHKVALIGVTAAGIAGLAYYNAAQRLTFTPGKINFQSNGQIRIQIVANNNSRFAFPVPALNAGIFDNNDNYLGTVISNTWQLIPAGGGIIEAVLQPNYSSVFSTLTNYATGTLPQHITITGTIRVGRFQIPFETKQTLAA